MSKELNDKEKKEAFNTEVKQLCNMCQEPKEPQDDDLCIDCWQKYRNL